jgi:hypothetical protein
MKKDIFFGGGLKRIFINLLRENTFITNTFARVVFSYLLSKYGMKFVEKRAYQTDLISGIVLLIRTFYLHLLKMAKNSLKSVFFTYVTFETMFWQIKLRSGVPRL